MAGLYDAGFTAPDIGPGASFIASIINANRQNARSNEYLDLEKKAIKNRADRESAALARQKELDKYRRDVEAWNAMPMLQRAAMRSVGMANANPYGVKFEEDQGPAPSIKDVDIMGAKDNAYGAHAAQVLLGQVPQREEPRTMDPTMGQHSGAPSMAAQYGTPSQSPAEEAMEPSHDEAAEMSEGESPGIQQAQAIMGQPRSKKLYANYQGQRFEVPEQQDTTGMGDKYDALYRRMLEEPGVTPAAAFKAVMGDYEKDQADAARDRRLTQTLGFRGSNREDQQTFQAGQNELYKNERITIADRDRWNAATNRARVSAAGAGPVSPVVPQLIRLTEEGAPASEVYDVAAKNRVPQKQFSGAIQNVVKNAAAGERAGQRREALTATDDRNNVIGVWKDANAAKTGAKQIESYHRVKERLAELIKDIESQGDRVISANTKDYQNRLSKAKAVVAALRPFNELSNTAAGQQMEEDIVGAIGTPGHGWLMGASADIIKRLAEEAEGQHQAQLSTKLRPGGGSQLAPALGGPRRGQQGGAHPAEAPVGETRQGPDGRTYRKVGPNNWQPVTQ